MEGDGAIMTRVRELGLDLVAVEGEVGLGDRQERVMRLPRPVEEWVRQHLDRRAERAGGLSQRNVLEVLASTTMRKRVKEEGGEWVSQKAAHVGWAWVAEREKLRAEAGEEAEGVERLMQGRGVVMPGWREAAMSMSGYGEGERLTVVEVREVRLVEMVYRALAYQVGGVSQDGAMWVEAYHQIGAWNSVKQTPEFRGGGGREMFWRCMAMLMLEGRVEGCPGRGPREGDWWVVAKSMFGRLGLEVGGVGGAEAGVAGGEEGVGDISAILEGGTRGGGERDLGVGRVVRVCLEWAAGAQSGKRAAVQKGYIYRGVDIRRFVWSAVTAEWVENLGMDLMKGTFQGLWEAARKSVEEEVGHGVEVVLGFLMGGPCCVTFSKMNRVNLERGCAYRGPDGEPVEGVYGEAAVAGDNQVKRFQAFIRWVTRRREFKGHFRGWSLENPVGDLGGRPYMRGWQVKHVRREVHLCAYGHYYMKPTHIWTSVTGWEPRGQTGDGKCGSRCSQGSLGEKGKWQHKYALGVASQRAKGGVGRKEMKQAIPHLLHLEILEAAE